MGTSDIFFACWLHTKCNHCIAITEWGQVKQGEARASLFHRLNETWLVVVQVLDFYPEPFRRAVI